MKQIIIFLLTILTASCNSDKQKFIIQTENQYDTIEGKKQIVSQTIKTLRMADSLPITILTRVSNYNNDSRLKYLTGLDEEEGLQDYLLDSIYYDNIGNDTLKKSFVYFENNWQPSQTFYKKFNPNKQVSYFMTERPFKKDFYSKKEIFYVYNKDGKILTETEAECSIENAGFSHCDCDSIFKTIYSYNTIGKLDSKICYTWTNNEWTVYKKKNGR